MQLIDLIDIFQDNYNIVIVRDCFQTDLVNMMKISQLVAKKQKEISIYIGLAHSIRKL